VPRTDPRGQLMSEMGQKRPKLPWLRAAKNTTEQTGNFVPIADVFDVGDRMFQVLGGRVRRNI
jgi:hypothetical protein